MLVTSAVGSAVDVDVHQSAWNAKRGYFSNKRFEDSVRAGFQNIYANYKLDYACGTETRLCFD
jgi:hypothetical protein